MSVKATFIIPCRTLSELTLATLRATRRIEDTETIIVVDGSREPTLAPTEARVLYTGKTQGPAFARNWGARAARGELLVFVDSDVAATESALRGLLAELTQTPSLAAVFGSYDSAPSAPGLPSQYRNLLHHYVHQRSCREASTFWSGFGAIRAKVFHRVGGFDERFTVPSIEDIELGARICGRGDTIKLCPELQVTHTKAWSVPSILHTDLFRRAIPWADLLASGRARFNTDLNLSLSNRLSVALAAAQLASLPSGRVSLLLLLLYIAANSRVLWFFARARGIFFTIGAAGLLWLHHLTCLAGLCAGTVNAARRSLRKYRRASFRCDPNRAPRVPRFARR